MAIENTPFQTRARTVDHLGREQIADCPTAISELWKNSYDAYARSVELNIFDASNNYLPVAALVDDGHGMSKQEFVEKWLVIGTDSKAAGQKASSEDRNGLPERPRQGQKGIGRLSSAAMGSLLLLISKRKNHPFIASLVDWRIFENPYLLLNDIQLPVVEFHTKSELRSYLPEMFDSLMSNIWGTRQSKDKDRDDRINLAWNTYDEYEKREELGSTKSAIENTIIGSSFDSRHFDNWSVWRGESDHGTALFISQLSDDLISQLSEESINNDDSLVAGTKRKLFETLSGFIDPYIRNTDKSQVSDFEVSVNVWRGLLLQVVLDKVAQFNTNNLDQLEHFVEGTVNEKGIFTGDIRIFGKDFKNVVVKPREPISLTSAARVGPFHIRFGTFELQIGNTTHTDIQHAKFMEDTEKYGGFMLHRDGFRIMPYGREDNDYFEIEKRRLKNAGDYFWSARRTFGGVKITRENNPNLRDKAGREGIIENKAAKQFKLLVTNILEDIGRNHFGRNSENRKEMLPKVQADRARQRAEADRKKLQNSQRKALRKKIEDNFDRIFEITQTLEDFIEGLALGKHLDTQDNAVFFQRRISDLASELEELRLPASPGGLGTLEREHSEYIKQERKISALLNQITSSINIALENLFDDDPKNLIELEIQKKYELLHKRILKWEAAALKELDSESARLKTLKVTRLDNFKLATSDLPIQVANEIISPGKAISLLDELYLSNSQENEEIFPPYIAALQSLRDQIDLQGLAAFSVKESEALREEIGRVHALAQLGVTVEIIGHEIEGLDINITRNLNAMPENIKRTPEYETVLNSHRALSDKWRFLSPLKLSGEKIYRNISGTDISKYVNQFFDKFFERSDIELTITESFKNFKINELPPRLYPVFVNLINNARYWVRHTKESKKQILIDYVDGKVLIADNGPGVDEEDIAQLFTLFFTKKASGGRGVGLYLCRANLAAGGHSIRYEFEEKKKLLSGANFVIEFRGVKNGQAS